MSSSNVGLTPNSRDGVARRVIGFGTAGASALAVAGAVEGLFAFYALRAMTQALFPHAGEFVMTPLNSGLPIGMALVGLLFGGIGLALFGGSYQAQENANATLAKLLRNALLGTVLAVFAGGLGALALSRSASAPSAVLFTNFYYGAFFGFILGLVVSFIVSAMRRPNAG